MIDDYRRGRVALGYLLGRRPSLRTVSRARHRSWPLAVAIGAPAVAFALLLAVDGNPFGKPTMTPPPQAKGEDQATGAVIGPAVIGGRPSFLPAKEIRYASWEEAQARVVFALKEPAWLPEGYWLSALQSFVPQTGSSADEIVDSVVATYTGPDGSYLSVDQFWLAKPEEFDLRTTLSKPPAGVGHGVVQVGGQTALWQAGIATLDEAFNPTGWDSSVIVLTWVEGRIGYRLQANGVDLATLVRVGDSLR